MRYLWSALSTAARLFTVLAWTLLGAIAIAVWSPAEAQSCTAGGSTTCFAASRTAGESPLSTVLTWNVVGASACTASGVGPWSGSVPTSGTRNLSGITTVMTLRLDCVAPATAGRAQLGWTPPATNTDGTPYTLRGGYVIEYGTSPASLTQTVSIASATAIAHTFENLAAGTWHFAIKARTSGCFPNAGPTCYESARSATASKTVTTAPGGALPQLSLALEPYQVPSPPTNVVATDVTAFAIDENDDGSLTATRVELVPLSTTCADDRCTVLARRVASN